MVDYEIFPENTLHRIAKWFDKNLDIILLVPNMTAVGNCAEEIYFSLLKARKFNKKVILIWPFKWYGLLRINFTNEELLNLESDYFLFKFDCIASRIIRFIFSLYIFLSLVISKFFKVLTGKHLSNAYIRPSLGVNYLWHDQNINYFSWDAVRSKDWSSEITKPIAINLSLDRKKDAEKLRQEMGIPLDAWFACLHVRESGFRDTEKYSERQLYSERNASISNYFDLIDEVVKRGGWVVRLGDRSMTQIRSQEKVIDYPFTIFKSELMDLYLISECKFYIGMTSGIYDVARLFQKPIVLTNMNNWLFAYPMKKNDIGITKHVFSKSRNKFLSLKEWILEPWAAVSYSHPIGEDYIFYENSPEELRVVVCEYMDKMSCAYDAAMIPLEEEIASLRIQRGREIISNKIFNEENVQSYYKKNVSDYDLLERYRLASRLESAVGSIGKSFLMENWIASSKSLGNIKAR